jgi:predicted GIY-YIG superfamily endonuclease
MTNPDAPPLVFTGEHVLYRLFGAEEKLLYVGITNHIGRRFRTHAEAQPWWPDVVDCRTEFHRSRAELEAAERTAIRTEHPLHNKAHKVVFPIDSDGVPIVDIPSEYFEVPESRPRVFRELPAPDPSQFRPPRSCSGPDLRDYGDEAPRVFVRDYDEAPGFDGPRMVG